MKNLSLEDQVQKMQFVIYQVPVGLIEAHFDGRIVTINAKAVELLMPQFFHHGLDGQNINHLWQVTVPGVLDAVLQYRRPSGCILERQEQEIEVKNEDGLMVKRHYVFTVNKLDADTVMYMFDDVSHIHEQEQLISKTLQEKAVEHSKFEMASGVLHDIGNAVVGFGSYISKIKRVLEESNLAEIENLKRFFTKNQPAFESAIGAQKAQALTDLLQGIITTNQNRQNSVRENIADQMKIIGHIEEILTIQRQYVVGKTAEREPVELHKIIADTVTMLSVEIETSKIDYQFESSAQVPKMKGDRTKLVQVFLNLVKNAIEAVNDESPPGKAINIVLRAEKDYIEVVIRDNGKGFDENVAAQLFTRGFTTKAEGAGIGLDNCRSVIEGHSGSLDLTSEGPGKGAQATIRFQL